MKQTIAFLSFLVLPALVAIGGAVTFQVDGEIVEIKNTTIKAEQGLFSLFSLSQQNDILNCSSHNKI